MATNIENQGIFLPAPASPLGSFAPQPYAMTANGQPIQDYAANQMTKFSPSTLSIPAPADPNAALAQKVSQIAGSASAGFSAGGQIQPTPNSADASLQTISAGVQGAGTGAAIGAAGGPPGMLIGAGVGGLVGLVSGGINSYLGLRNARAQRRQQERQYAEIRKMQKEERDYQRMVDAMNRGDKLEETRYNRHINRVKAQWDAQQMAMSRINDMLRSNADFREAFIKGAR